MVRRFIGPLLVLAALAGTPGAFAQEPPPPTDAIGNIRVSQAPYVQPADHDGRLMGPDFTLDHCMVSCPAESIDVVEFRSGADGSVRKMPGRYHAGDVTICCDKATMKPLLDWFRAIQTSKSGSPGRDLTLEILARSADGKPVVACKFLLRRAWPHQINWSGNGSVCVQLTVESTDLVSPSTAG